jgi:hypothetical protein
LTGNLVETTKHKILTLMVEKIVKGEQEEALKLYTALFDMDFNLSSNPQDIIFVLFGKALIKQFDPQLTNESNLYLKSYEISQIELFNLLAKRLPFASYASMIANDILLHLMNGEKEITLIDIGIGTGRQMVDLLDLLKSNQYTPKLTICGIEPDHNSLRQARKHIEDRANQLGLDTRFIPILSTIEDISVQSITREIRGKAMINAAFALHHIRERPGTIDVRDEVLHKLRSIEPAGVVLCEPDSNHNQVGLKERFRQSWNHYGTLFACIDGLAISNEEKLSLKVFFGREIEDVLGNCDENRSERHESTRIWLQRLTKVGFSTYSGYRRQYAGKSDITIQNHVGYYGLQSEDTNVSSVIYVV